MAAGGEVLLRQRQCRERSCGTVFYVCRACDRGQGYCATSCREKARREQRRAANRKHQTSDEGRQDHRDRQRAYRLRLVCRVTDQGIGEAIVSSTLRALSEWRVEAAAEQTVCRFCGRGGRLVDPFTE